jgi:hypothetical protein
MSGSLAIILIFFSGTFAYFVGLKHGHEDSLRARNEKRRKEFGL